MLEAIGSAIIEKTLKRIAGNLLEKLGQKATDNLVELVCEKLTLFNQEGKDNPDDLTRILKEIPELQNITNNDMSTAFNITFGNITNSQITLAQKVYNGCTFKNDMDKQEIKELIFETLQTIPLDNPKTIERLRPFFNKAYRVIEECYDYEDKKDLLKKLMKERIEKSVNDDFLEIRECDTAIEIIAKLTKEELNLLALFYIALGINIEELLTIEIINKFNLNESQIEQVVIYLYLETIKKFSPIDTIDQTSTATIFAQYGLNTTNLMYAKSIFLYEDKSVLNQILADPSMEFLKEHLDIFNRYLLQFRNHIVFQKIGQIYLDEKMRGITFDILEILKDETK